MRTAPQFTDVLVDLATRVSDGLAATLEGLSAEAMTWRPDAAANPIGWLAWHTIRIQDDHVADLQGIPQRYAADGWAQRLGLPDDHDIGYGHDADDVARHCPTDPEAVRSYLDAVASVTIGFLSGLEVGDLDRIVDERWDPPVTMAVRVASILTDNLQHVGQAAYVLGLWERR